MLESVVADVQRFVGGRVQDIRQPSPDDVVLSIYAGGEAMLLLSCHPLFFRAHFVTRKVPNAPVPPQFLSALRARLAGAVVTAITQLPGERILNLLFDNGCTLVAELMGKHSNLMLLDDRGLIVGAAKWVGRSKSVRVIQPNVPYVLPPVVGGEIRRSRFYAELAAAGATFLPHPVIAPGHGAYPVSVSALGWTEHPRESISIALEQFYTQRTRQHEIDALKSSLLGQLSRVALAREAALADLRDAESSGGKAPQWQRDGELILVYGAAAPTGASILEAFDYDGVPVVIRLDPELSFKENANAYFTRAKKAKGRLGYVRDQQARLESDLASLQSLQQRVEAADDLSELEGLRDQARQHRWLQEQLASGKPKDERPYEGHRVRELRGPGGFLVLVGETAEANDYLTLRVAKPNDYWLHVRGNTSAHVVIQTGKHPEKVQREVLEYAARVAVLHSSSKHSGYVPVDYTLRKYVRKPRGAAKGTAIYTHEKTLHVEA